MQIEEERRLQWPKKTEEGAICGKEATISFNDKQIHGFRVVALYTAFTIIPLQSKQKGRLFPKATSTAAPTPGLPQPRAPRRHRTSEGHAALSLAAPVSVDIFPDPDYLLPVCSVLGSLRSDADAVRDRGGAAANEPSLLGPEDRVLSIPLDAFPLSPVLFLRPHPVA
ncbi:hypothetical protein MUK42_34532 [Musa troglodytarum]|uniref:Uncharacterized protein n=1 Tax=Musa troglodytarum TaxID=320322 RepID=A0A9E7JTF0_9LILI|nr:hypothetical protein MUK42_34532 [Musa troglodytarum]